ncbi:MAG: hypothetical protein K0V04_35760 [Deltaproteobacteria bacterium]|nr:hypothetical protein [Deltaproteobacteria bacterium]
MTESLAKADQKETERKAAEQAKRDKAGEQAKAAKAGKLEHPWSFDGIKTSLKIGTTLAYAMEGTNAKGKPIEDTLRGEVHGHDDLDVKILQYKDSQKDIPAVMQAQGHPWGKLSPFFWVEKSKTTLLRKESVEVPAGSFDCVVAEIKGFFGTHLTVWMIVDQPGIYAQVIEHPNTNAAEADEGTPTEVTYRLASLEREQ